MAVIEIPLGTRLELAESGETTETFRGWLGTRKFIVNQADKIWLAPKIGEPFASDMPYLTCASVRRTPLKDAMSDQFGDTKYVMITAEYSTLPRNKRVRERLNISYRALQTTRGRTWKSDGAVCEQAITLPYPITEWILTTEQQEIQRNQAFMLTGRVNSKPFGGTPAGYLLFEGASSGDRQDENGLWVHETNYIFVYQGRPWSEVWREDIGDFDEPDPAYDEGDFALLGLDI